MKKYILHFIFTCLLLFTLPTQAADTYTLDPNHTYVIWYIKHFDFSTQAGKFYASGTLVLDKDHPQNSKVDATIKVADISTGLPELDKHLKEKLFFNVDQYPLATFVSKKVEMTSKTTAKVDGILTLHGVSKPIVLNVKLNKAGVSPITDKMTVGFSATAKLKRSDFGMTTLLPGLGDDVRLDIEAEAYKS